MFFITLFALAGLYVLAMADFVAITQIVIYVGGILVLILFAFMLSGRENLNYVAAVQNKFISVRFVRIGIFDCIGLDIFSIVPWNTCALIC